MPILPGRRTLFRDLLLTLSLITLVAVGLLGTILYVLATQREETKVVRSADRLADEIAKAVALPLLNLEGDIVSQIAEAYLSSDFIAGLSLKSEGLIFWEQAPVSSAGLIERHRSVMSGDMKAGELTVFFRRDSIHAIRMTVVWIMTATMLCVILVGIPALYFLVRHMVNKPLIRLGEGLRLIAAGDDSRPLESAMQDEINDIVIEVNQMADKIRQRNRQILESESRFRDIFDNANDGIFQLMPSGALLRANPATAKLLGYSSVDVLLEESERGSASCLSEIIRVVTGDEGPTGKEMSLTRKDGTVIWARIKARPVCDDAGKVLYIEGFMEDITPAKEMQEALMDAKDQLESQVETRTRDLREKTEKMERMNRLFIARELAMKKLKEENRALKKQLDDKESS